MLGDVCQDRYPEPLATGVSFSTLHLAGAVVLSGCRVFVWQPSTMKWNRWNLLRSSCHGWRASRRTRRRSGSKTDIVARHRAHLHMHRPHAPPALPWAGEHPPPCDTGSLTTLHRNVLAHNHYRRQNTPRQHFSLSILPRPQCRMTCMQQCTRQPRSRIVRTYGATFMHDSRCTGNTRTPHAPLPLCSSNSTKDATHRRQPALTLNFVQYQLSQ